MSDDDDVSQQSLLNTSESDILTNQTSLEHTGQCSAGNRIVCQYNAPDDLGMLSRRQDRRMQSHEYGPYTYDYDGGEGTFIYVVDGGVNAKNSVSQSSYSALES